MVSVDEHKVMVRLGIKQRRDGLFGYKLKCARKSCNEFVDTCFGVATLTEAIHNVTRSRSSHHHDAVCWFSDDAAWDGMAMDIRDYVQENGIEEGGEWANTVIFLKSYPRKGSGWLRHMRQEDSAAYRLMQNAWQSACNENADYEPEDNEVDCEVAS